MNTSPQQTSPTAFDQFAQLVDRLERADRLSTEALRRFADLDRQLSDRKHSIDASMADVGRAASELGAAPRSGQPGSPVDSLAAEKRVKAAAAPFGSLPAVTARWKLYATRVDNEGGDLPEIRRWVSETAEPLRIAADRLAAVGVGWGETEVQRQVSRLDALTTELGRALDQRVRDAASRVEKMERGDGSVSGHLVRQRNAAEAKATYGGYFSSIPAFAFFCALGGCVLTCAESPWDSDAAFGGCVGGSIAGALLPLLAAAVAAGIHSTRQGHLETQIRAAIAQEGEDLTRAREHLEYLTRERTRFLGVLP